MLISFCSSYGLIVVVGLRAGGTPDSCGHEPALPAFAQTSVLSRVCDSKEPLKSQAFTCDVRDGAADPPGLPSFRLVSQYEVYISGMMRHDELMLES